MKIPDLLFPTPYLAIDRQALEETLGLAFLGRELGTQLHDELAKARLPSQDRLRRRAQSSAPDQQRAAHAATDATPSPTAARPSPGGDGEVTFRPEFFGGDLFLRTLLEQSFQLNIDQRQFPVNYAFLERVIQFAPTDRETIELRQGILEELELNDQSRGRVEKLYRELFDLMSLMKTPGFSGTLNLADFRLDILHQLKKVIDMMATDFDGCSSALRRLSDSAIETQAEEPYRLLSDLLEYESGLAKMTLDVTVGADGKLRSFVVRGLEENERNRFHRAPGRRFLDALLLGFRGYSQSRRELMSRLVDEVFRQLSDPMVPYVQLLGHLEFYLTSLGFRRRAQANGLDVSRPTFNFNSVNPAISGNGVQIESMFNPLLLGDAVPPVPCSLRTAAGASVVLITGPNSGGKTRLLQALGLTQLLAQAGTYVPCAKATLQLQSGLFVSLIEEEGARVTEGRLGRELVRIRSLFEKMAPRSLVILDELCSGTNPSEGVEVFTLVLQLLEEVQPTAFVTTHFLDYARSLSDNPVIAGLEFLQVEVDSQLRSTYQFVPGVANTSLAAVTAERLGVTFESLAGAIRRRRHQL